MYCGRHRQVTRTLRTTTRSDATMYALGAYSDGGIGIARDGAPLPQLYWPSSEMDTCVESFIRLAQLHRHGTQVHPVDAN